MVKIIKGGRRTRAKIIMDKAKELLKEQRDEDTPKVDIEDVLELLVSLTEQVERIDRLQRKTKREQNDKSK